jgi:acyl carrier protein
VGEEDRVTERDVLANVTQDLQAFVTRQVLREERNLAVDVPLVESGLVDSLGLLQIIVHIEKQYGVALTESGSPADFRSISSLAAAVQRIRTKGSGCTPN